MNKALAALAIGVPVGLWILLESKDAKAVIPTPTKKPVTPPTPPVIKKANVPPTQPSKPAPRPIPTEPGSFIASLPELRPRQVGESTSTYRAEMARRLRERTDMIVSAIEQMAAKGDWGGNVWTTVISKGDRYTATIPVMADAYKLDGVRFNTDFIGAQHIADIWGAHLVTPYVLDLIHEQSGTKVLPQTLTSEMEAGRGSYTKNMVLHSQLVDQAIEQQKAQGSPGPWKTSIGWNTGLVNNAGKHWVLTKRNWEKPNYGANYGWYHYGQADGVIQGVIPGLHHNIHHVDYSQTLRLMGPLITLTDNATSEQIIVPTENLLKTDDAVLLTGKPTTYRGGTLPSSRHPNIAMYEPGKLVV